MNKLFGILPPFALPIPVAALIWAVLYFTGNDSRPVVGWLFGIAFLSMLLIGLVGAAREKSLNDKAGPQ